MPKIAEEKTYNGVKERIERLGMARLLKEVREIITAFPLLVKEERDANGGAAVRRLIDARFEAAQGWVKKQTGGIDWTKCLKTGRASTCVGVEIQFSARSDLVVIDLIHLRKAIVSGQVDVGILVVPDDHLGRFLTDRGPKMSDAKRHVVETRAEDLPLLIIALRHNGPGPPLAKQLKRQLV